eukprot:TRINITY_DN18006_c0_g1_i1.p1 TRINITY_DN18006_c0_g1~~TRINITY_DN18006_c0_g1_i1.p1  ORF type:complete len:163 (-),score=76.85 TRINITY_DN18006_c0_g1_i1:1346-1789(-)
MLRSLVGSEMCIRDRSGMMGGYGGMQMPMAPPQPQYRTNNNPYQAATTVGSSGWDTGSGGGSAPGYYSSNPGMLQNESSAMNAMMHTFVSQAGAGATSGGGGMPHQTTHLPYYASSGNPSSTGNNNGGGAQDHNGGGGGGGWNQGQY